MRIFCLVLLHAKFSLTKFNFFHTDLEISAIMFEVWWSNKIRSGVKDSSLLSLFAFKITVFLNYNFLGRQAKMKFQVNWLCGCLSVL